MNKLALLINYSETYDYELWDDDTKGMYHDVECMKNYLLSPLGGAWHNDEIMVFHKTTQKDLQNLINIVKNSSLAFSFIYFSGHGYLQDDELFLQINNQDGQDLQEYLLRNIAQKNLVILDCCRKTPEVISEESVKIASFTDLPTLDYDKHRNYYEELINNSNVGNTVLYACSKEECAYGNELGGNYTQKLLRCARRWQTNCINKINKDYLSSYLAHAEAKVLVTQAQAEQHPSIEKARSGITPPFAVYIQ